MDWIQAFILAFVAFLGAAFVAYYGWLKTSGPFDWRQYQISLIAGLFAALVWVMKYQVQGSFGWLDVVTAFVFGAGADHIVNISSAIREQPLLEQIATLKWQMDQAKQQNQPK